jgi:hypothetical protein
MADSDDGGCRSYIDEATGVSAFKVIRLGNACLEDCFPYDQDQRDWCGIYCRCGRRCCMGDGSQINDASSIVLVKSDFEWVRRRFSVQDRGILILFRRDFLPEVVERKLDRLPLFLQQGYGPFQLDALQKTELKWIVDKTWIELTSSYRFKKELLMSLVLQVIHFVIKHFTADCCDWSGWEQVRIN